MELHANGPAPEGKPPQAAADGAAGAPPSNTAPGNSSGDGGRCSTAIVGAGIDSLYLSVPGNLRPDIQRVLDSIKTMAQSRDEEVRAIAQYPMADEVFQVSDKGARVFSYVLTDWRFRMELARPSETLPLAHVKVSSVALSALGVQGCVDDLMATLRHFGELVEDPVVSRVDLFVDAQTGWDLSRLEDDQWLTRAKSAARYVVQGQRSGHTIGQGGDMSIRLYNKTLEISAKGQSHAKGQWELRGWNPVQAVWRVESQIRRNVLRDFGVHGVDDLLGGVGELWTYSVRDWCRLVLPNAADQTPSRWPVHPFWAAIMAAPDFSTSVPVKRRVLRRSGAPGDYHLALAFLSALTSFMAAYEIFDTAWALDDLEAMIYGCFASQEESGGPSLSRYIARQVANKVRTYGTGRSFKVPQDIPLKTRPAPRQTVFPDDDDAE